MLERRAAARIRTVVGDERQCFPDGPQGITTFNDSAAAPANIHFAVGLLQRARHVGVRSEHGDADRGAGCDRLSTESQCQPVDSFFERRRLGFGVGLAEILQ